MVCRIYAARLRGAARIAGAGMGNATTLDLFAIRLAATHHGSSKRDKGAEGKP
jgi:hypothetical protein